jgi:hypothetical protein
MLIYLMFVSLQILMIAPQSPVLMVEHVMTASVTSAATVLLDSPTRTATQV